MPVNAALLFTTMISQSGHVYFFLNYICQIAQNCIDAECELEEVTKVVGTYIPKTLVVSFLAINDADACHSLSLFTLFQLPDQLREDKKLLMEKMKMMNLLIEKLNELDKDIATIAEEDMLSNEPEQLSNAEQKRLFKEGFKQFSENKKGAMSELFKLFITAFTGTGRDDYPYLEIRQAWTMEPNRDRKKTH